MTTVTMVYEGNVVSAAAEPGDEDLWLAPAALHAGTGLELTAAGFCRGSICIPIPPERRGEFVRGDGGLNLAALARHRGQAVVHDDERRVWAFGAPPVVAGRYGWVSVPTVAWIDEDGRLVRPGDPGWAGDYFRGMVDPDFDHAAMMAEYGRLRDRYLDAVRDWVARGTASRWALPPGEVRRRLAGPDRDHALAAAYFQLGTALHEAGRPDAARVAFEKAKALRPDSWSLKRQAWHLEEAGKSAGPEFWAAVKALGDRPYYPRHDL